MRTLNCILGRHEWSQWFTSTPYAQKMFGVKEYRYCKNCGYTERR